MPAVDDAIAGLGGGGVIVALGVAILLGLRHATDPDHLTAVATLAMTRGLGARRAGTLGFAWGAGHATTLVLFGAPVVLLHRQMPVVVERGAELAIGLVIVMLAVRLLMRLRRGHAHARPRRHAAYRNGRPEDLGRSPHAAYGIGLIHGLGGSAAVGVLLVGAVPGRVAAVAALLVFAGATALSMGILSTAFGRALATGPAARRIQMIAPALGTLSLLFGAWYAVSAI